MFQLGDPITILTCRFTIDQVVATGLTVNVSVYLITAADPNGALLTTGVAVHVAGGSYAYTLAGSLVTIAGTYLFDFVPTVTTDQDGARIAVSAGLGGVEHLGNVAVEMTSPIAPNGNVNIEQADDYYESDARALNFTFSGAPVLTGATSVLLKIGEVDIEGTVISATQLRFQPTTEETALLDGDVAYEIEVVLSNGHRVTLQTGKAIVRGTL